MNSRIPGLIMSFKGTNEELLKLARDNGVYIPDDKEAEFLEKVHDMLNGTPKRKKASAVTKL